jgi:hypothetical protein
MCNRRLVAAGLPRLQFAPDELLRSMSNREQRFGWLVFAGLILLIIWALTHNGAAS